MRASNRLARTLLSVAIPVLFAACRPASATSAQAPFEGRLVGRLIGDGGRPFGLGVSSVGRVFALRLDTDKISVYEAGRDSSVGEITVDHTPIDITVTRDGKRAFVSLLSGDRIFEVDLEEERVLRVTHPGKRHHRIALVPDERAYHLLSLDGVVRRITRSTGVVADSALVGTTLRGMSTNPEDASLVVTGDDRVWRLDQPTMDITSSSRLGMAVQEVVHSRDGRRVHVAVEGTRTIHTLDALTLAPTDSIRFATGEIQPFGMALSRDGRTLLVSSPATGTVAVLRTRPLALVRMIPVSGTPRRVVFSADGRTAFVTNEAGWVDILR